MAHLGENSSLWKLIWQSEASPICKRIVWKACNEELPMRSLMVERGTLDNATCPCCGNADETTTHAFLLCEEARHIWFASPLTFRMDSHIVINLSQWIEQFAQDWDKEQMGMVITIMWALWIKRNMLVDENKKLDCAQVLEKAGSMLNSKYEVAWRPPSRPFIKANFSASVEEDRGTGMGVIFRNSSGETIASGSKFLINECFEPVIAEALCYIWAVEELEELGLSDVIFETDCQELHTQLINAPIDKISASNSYLDSLVQECLLMMRRTRSYLELVRPTANKVAHCLATAASDYGQKIWIGIVVPKDASLALEADIEAMANLKAE